MTARRMFVLGLVFGLLLAPASASETWRRLRDGLAQLIDRVLRVGMR